MAERIGAAGGRAAVVQGDLADAAAVERLVPEAVRALGPLTLLVNNASEFEPDEVETLSQERWDRHFAVNLRAPGLPRPRFRPPASRRRARAAIVNIVDQRVWKLTPQFFSYTLTKAALFTRDADHGAGARAAHPRQCHRAGPDLSNVRQGDEDFAKQSDAVLLGRGGTPDEIADAVRLSGARAQRHRPDDRRRRRPAPRLGDAGRRRHQGVSAIAEISRP